MQALKPRKDVAPELTWDLSKLFTNDESCRRVCDETLAAAQAFQEEFQGRLSRASGEQIVQAIRRYEEISTRGSRAICYANLRTATDMSDLAATRLMAYARQSLSQMYACLTFYDDEMTKIDAQKFDEVTRLAPEYRHYIQDIQAMAEHLLSPEEEKLLAKLEPQLGLPETVYDISKAADMQFPDFSVDDKTYPLSYVLYETHYCGEPDTQVRRQAFRTFSKTLQHYHNITGALYNSQVQYEKTMATERGFASVFDYLLFRQKVSRDHYDRHLDTTMEKLAPIMQKWAKLLGTKYGLEEIHYADLKLPLFADESQNIEIAEAKDYIRDAMAPMGPDYQDLVMRFDQERWVDFPRNQGKSTGGFCTVPAKAQPYILLNWSHTLAELYTLAHELGHAAQGLLCEQHNAPLEADFTWYDVESPSTFHEMLLSYSLLKKAEAEGDQEAQKKVLACMIENTYYHNFVTHFLEAYYQRAVYRLVDQGEQLQADDFDRLFRETLEKFWGDAVVLDPGSELTWMRQPHYYNGLYSYTYSCSLVISTEMYRRLRTEGADAASDWIKFLQTGGPMAPVEHAKLAKIDISDSQALERTLDFIGEIVDQVATLMA